MNLYADNKFNQSKQINEMKWNMVANTISNVTAQV